MTSTGQRLKRVNWAGLMFLKMYTGLSCPKLKIQQLPDILAEQWKLYMQNLDTMYTDATCYESEMRYPTDPKLLWEGIEKSYETMCELSKRLIIHPPAEEPLPEQGLQGEYS